MTIAIIITIIILIGYFWVFKPQGGIYYIVTFFNLEFSWIANTEKHRAWPLYIIARPVFQVNQFYFEFSQLMEEKTAIKRGFSIDYNIPGDLKVVVTRNELVWGYLAQEIHPVVVSENTKDKVAVNMVFLITYEPVDPVCMKKSAKNWLQVAEAATG